MKEATYMKLNNTTLLPSDPLCYSANCIYLSYERDSAYEARKGFVVLPIWDICGELDDHESCLPDLSTIYCCGFVSWSNVNYVRQHYTLAMIRT